jgi:AraC-like DNA-binding protein
MLSFNTLPFDSAMDGAGKTMDDNGNFLQTLFPETLVLTPTMRPFKQSQDDSWSIRSAVYQDYDLFICWGGGAIFSINEQEYALTEGRAFLAPPGQTIHARKLPGPRFQALAQHFTLKLPGGVDFFEQFDYAPCVALSQWPRVLDLTFQYEKATTIPQERIQAQGLLLALIGEFARDAWRADRVERDPRYGFVYRMAREIELGLDDPHILDRVLASTPYSADYASRIFRNRMGTAPSRYLTVCRVKAAKERLIRGATVKEASYAAGFTDELYFSRVFSKTEGISPREFQAAHGVRR